LQSDIESVARTFGWYRRSTRTEDVARDAVDAIAAAMGPPAQVATLVLPADVSWGDGGTPAMASERSTGAVVADDVVERIAKILVSGEPTLLLLGNRANDEASLRAASRICAATGARMLTEVFPTRLERGAGVPAIDRLQYLAEFAVSQLGVLRHLVLVDA